MKNLFFSLGISLAVHALLPYQSMAQPNLIANGDFETQYATVRPSREQNIKGDRSYYLDELPSWRVPSAGSGPSPVSINATFLATNATNSDVNPNTNSTFYGSFPTHNNSTGCVGLKRSYLYPATDGLITQQVALTPGHKYQFGYYIMKRPGAGYASKFAFNVINSSSTPALSANNATSSFEPAPAVTVTTDLLTSTDWTYVTGSFIAQTPPANTQPWIVIGYDRSAEQTDPNAGGATSGNEVYILDDVSLEDTGVITCAAPGPVTATYNAPAGRVLASIAAVTGASSYNWYFEGSMLSGHSTSIAVIVARNDCFRQYSIQVEAVYPTGCVSARISADARTSGCPSASRVASATAYPNPATESLTIPQGVGNAILLNSQGYPVAKADASGHLDVRNLPAGLYNLQTSQEGKLTNQRIEVKH
jgi:hypothetical protein